MTKHAFPAYAFREQKLHLYKHLVKPRSMKIRNFISRLQEVNGYTEELPPDTEGQETEPLSPDKVMDIIFHSMPTTEKNKMIEDGFNYSNFIIKEMTDFFETRAKTLVLREERKKSFTDSKN